MIFLVNRFAILYQQREDTVISGKKYNPQSLLIRRCVWTPLSELCFSVRVKACLVRQTDRRTGRQTDRQRDRQTDRQTDIKMDGWTGGYADKETDRKMNKTKFTTKEERRNKACQGRLKN